MEELKFKEIKRILEQNRVERAKQDLFDAIKEEAAKGVVPGPLYNAGIPWYKKTVDMSMVFPTKH